MESIKETKPSIKENISKVLAFCRRFWPLVLLVIFVLAVMLGYYIRGLDNTVAQRATKIRVNKSVSDHLTDSMDQNWYQVTLPADGYITLQFDHPNQGSEEVQWQMYLYFEDAKQSVPGDGHSWIIRGNMDELSAEIGLPAGTYFVKIRSYGGNCDTSTYKLRVNYTKSNTCETEENYSYFDRSQADKIQVNTDYTGCIMGSDDVDMFVMTLPYEGYVTLNFSHMILNSSKTYWCVGLYKAEGEQEVAVDKWDIKGNENLITSEYILPKGTYYILIASGSYSRYDSSTYTLRVNFDFLPSESN